MGRKKSKSDKHIVAFPGYESLLSEVSELLESARRASSRSANIIITVTYWSIGQRITEHEQAGKQRAEYGKELLKQLARDLTDRFGRGFSERNLISMRKFYRLWPISQTASAESDEADNYIEILDNQISQTISAKSSRALPNFLLSWSHYVQLLSVRKKDARNFYEQEAIRGGWTIKQLTRQIGSQFYERTLLSKNKAAMLTKGQRAKPEDFVSVEEEIKDPYILEFLELKDEYSESDLEEALIHRLEEFLLELGGDFTFVGRQKRLRIDDKWYRVDLVFYHRKLRCFVIIDLKLHELNHADVGQMHLYLNYARKNWTHDDENPPVGLILCASKGRALAKYALDGLPNKVLAAEYKTALPDEQILVAEVEKTRKRIESRSKNK